jgi:hypothetical protein
MGEGLMYARYNYAAAFVAFTNGTPIEEVALVFDIPLETLQLRCREERWRELSEELPLVTRALTAGDPGTPALARTDPRTNAKLTLMSRNRDENFGIACALREDLKSLVAKLTSEEGLTVEKHFHNRGAVITHHAPLSIADRVNLATYARTIADLTYAALGDKTATQGKPEDGIAGSAGATPGITIILPGVIAEPREKRADTETMKHKEEPKKGQVIDVEEVTPGTGGQAH